MSKTFQEIEISNGSWIKEQSDPINILNENRFIDFSNDTFRLFDAMIFISYYASPLMHALEFLKQSLEYRDYWEKSIDYIISDINLKEYNNKSNAGIETFILLWNIVSNKSSYPAVIKKQLFNEIINTAYDSKMGSNAEEMCRKFVVNLNNAFNKYNFSFGGEYRKIKIAWFCFPNEFKNIDELGNCQSINILGMNFNPIEHSRKSLMMILNFKKIFFKIRYKFSSQGYKMINTLKRDIFAKLSNSKYSKQDYNNWFKVGLRNWLKSNFVADRVFDKTEKFLNNNITYEVFQQYKDEVKFDGPNKIWSKFGSIFNKVLSDINENTREFICKNYSSEINLINKDFNFGKSNSKNIFKN